MVGRGQEGTVARWHTPQRGEAQARPVGVRPHAALRVRAWARGGWVGAHLREAWRCRDPLSQHGVRPGLVGQVFNHRQRQVPGALYGTARSTPGGEIQFARRGGTCVQVTKTTPCRGHAAWPQRQATAAQGGEETSTWKGAPKEIAAPRGYHSEMCKKKGKEQVPPFGAPATEAHGAKREHGDGAGTDAVARVCARAPRASWHTSGRCGTRCDGVHTSAQLFFIGPRCLERRIVCSCR